MIFDKLNSIENRLAQITKQPPVGDNNEFLTVDQAAKLLNSKKSTIYKRTHTGTIPYYKTGNKLFFRKSELLQLIEANKIDPV